MGDIDLSGVAQNADELLDKTFPKLGADLLERSGLSDRVFFDESSKLFYMQNEGGEWVGRDKQTFATYLKFQGYCPVVNARKNEKISELEHVIGHVSLNCSVAYAGPIAGFKKGVVWNNGKRMLVTRDASLLEPVEGKWPTLEHLFVNMFGGGVDEENDGPNQLPYFYGTWKHALQCLQNRFDDKRILCLAMAGEAGCGKTLVKKLITRSLGGRECKPYRYMIGEENFSGDLLGSEVWGIDDEQGGDTSMKSRLKFGGELKMVVAEELYRIRGMMREGVVMEMFRFPVMCLNREPDRLKVLPPLDDDIADKISVLLAHKHPMPMPAEAPEARNEFWKTITAELPHFIHWLLNDYEVSVPYGRFGVTHFHHPDLCSDLFQVSRERELWSQVCRVMDKLVFKAEDALVRHWYWCGGADALHQLMAAESSPLSRNEKNGLPWSNSIGKNLSKIAKEYPERVVQKKVGGVQQWFICDDAHLVIDAVDMERTNRNRRNGGQS